MDVTINDIYNSLKEINSIKTKLITAVIYQGKILKLFTKKIDHLLEKEYFLCPYYIKLLAY